MKHLFFFAFAILPSYILPVLGAYISIRPYAKHWWPTLPELQVIILPIALYGFLSHMNDHQGYSIGLPSLIIAIPVMITLWLGPGEKDIWISFARNIPYWIGFGSSIIASLLVYYLYPHTSIGF